MWQKKKKWSRLWIIHSSFLGDTSLFVFSKFLFQKKRISNDSSTSHLSLSHISIWDFLYQNTFPQAKQKLKKLWNEILWKATFIQETYIKNLVQEQKDSGEKLCNSDPLGDYSSFPCLFRIYKCEHTSLGKVH